MPDSAFAEAEIIEPDDFNAEQAYRLAVAFGGDRELAQALMDRICAWTGGHPYLTQRVARGVARRGGRLEDVERAVREQLLAPGAAEKDLLLGHVRAWLGESARPARRATKLLLRLAAGGKTAQPADPAVWERLWLSGAVRVDSERKLRIRNRIVKELVAARWLKQRAAAALVGRRRRAARGTRGGRLLVYATLTVAAIETLSSATADLPTVEEAYRRLRGLPGFAQRADELWLEALGRHSRARDDVGCSRRGGHSAPRAAGPRRGRGSLAQRVLAAPRPRAGTRRAARAGDLARAARRSVARRDPAPRPISRSSPATTTPLSSVRCASPACRSTGTCRSHKRRSSRSTRSSKLCAHRSVPRPAPALSAPRRSRLTALQHSALTRELAIEGEGTAGEFELSLTVQHAAAAELLVTLAAPSGAEAALTVPRSDGVLVETFAFQAAPGSPLAQLADEGVRGVWRLTIVDRAAGNTGLFGGWGLSFGDNAGREDLPELLAIPDPQRVETVNVQAVADRAVAWPTSAGAIGTVALWNLTTGSSSTTSPCRPHRAQSRSMPPGRACLPRPIEC